MADNENFETTDEGDIENEEKFATQDEGDVPEIIDNFDDEGLEDEFQPPVDPTFEGSPEEDQPVDQSTPPGTPPEQGSPTGEGMELGEKQPSETLDTNEDEDAGFQVLFEPHEEKPQMRRGSSRSSSPGSAGSLDGIRPSRRVTTTEIEESSMEEYGECEGEDEDTDACLYKWMEIPGEENLPSLESFKSVIPSISPSYAEFVTAVEEPVVEEERPVTPPPPRVPSEEQFQELYMRSIPETPAKERMSLEVLCLEDREQTPTPPGTPKKTLRRMHDCPSVESFLKLGDPISVHFHVLPGQRLFSVEARLDRTIADLKHDISPICKVPPEFIDIRRNRNLVMDYKTLKDLGAKPRKKMKFTIEISKRCPPDFTLKIPVENKIEQFPTVVRKVKVQTDKGIKHVRVTIEFAYERKMFIGGYRDKRFNIVYHHSITQTPFYSEPYSDKVQHFSCQTFDNTWKIMQTSNETYSQTYRPDYHVSSVRDKVIWARPYLCTEYIEIKRIKAAIIIQKYWRRWLAIRERAERLDGLIRRVEWAENIRKGRTESRLAIKEDEMWRQHHPSRMVDIELLYRAINEWRRGQVEYVNLHRWGPDRKAALAIIMEKEADLLLDLERTKTTIRDATHDSLIESIFRKMGNPTRWLNRSGNFVAMDNKDKYDMRQYHKLYNTLKEPVTNSEERSVLLDKLTSYVKPYNSDLSQYLITLIRREKSLMERQAGEHLLIGLRQRIMNIFYHLLRDPLFNSEARKLQKVPFDSMKLRKDMVQCKGCRKMKYRDQFTVVRGVTVTTQCITDMALYRTAILRSDMNLYRRMLQELRHDEQTAGVESSVTYLIDAYDMQFLIEQLWHGQSALSGIDDRYLLRLCRWKRNVPWTPWNCVLLTEEESVAHLHLEDMNSAYQKSFFHKVHVKHQGARIYFARLTTLSIPLDPALETYCANLNKLKLGKKKRKVTLKK